MTVVALVPAKDREDSVGPTVRALRDVAGIDRVVVVDDGSRDATGEAAEAAGATVVRLARNEGKGAAIAAGAREAPDADVYLLIDADLGTTAGLADALLAPVVGGEADVAIAVLPGAGRKGGFGTVRRLAASGIRRATGFEARAPLSGQRAIRGELLRSLRLADRFGLETAMTIDAVRAGARLVEVDVPMDHRHTGRRLSGFRHRGRQGADIARALWSRLTTRRLRVALVAASFVFAVLASLWSAGRAEPTSVPSAAGSPPTAKVVIFGMPRLGWDDVGTGHLPTLDKLIDRGAIASTSVRTLSGHPNPSEAYATLGAGTRVKADDGAGLAFDAADPYEGGTAAEALARRTGTSAAGAVVVLGTPETQRLNDGRFLTSRAGALGTALERAGRRTAVVGNADTLSPAPGRSALLRPAAVAVMDHAGAVDAGTVGRQLLHTDDAAPFGVAADPSAMLAALDRSLASADVVLVDPGDLDRAAAFAPLAGPKVAAAQRTAALASTDALLAQVVDRLPADALLMVVSVAPPGPVWHLTPTVLVGPGVPHGYLHSPSTRRPGVVTITDLAPTVLDRLGVPVPDGMIGHALRFRPGAVDLAKFRNLDRDAAYRERIYLPLTIIYIVVQAILYLLAMFGFGRLGGVGRAAGPLKAAVLAISAFPLATFLLRATPNAAALGAAGGIALLLALDAAVVALAWRAKRHALSPLSWILGATVVLLCLDVATGARLQTSSLLGYSLHTAARFTGLGNTAFAALASTTVLLGAIHLHFAPRRDEALVSVALLFAFVILVDGAPSLGSDVGGILTLVPVFGLTLFVLSGRRLSRRAVVTAAAVTAGALVLATGVDLLRPAASQTHLGRLVHDIAKDGPSAFTTTVSRKLAVNFRTYRSPWSWAIIVISIYLLYVLAWTRGWRNLLPPRSALRVGTVAALAVGLLGYAVNDSGVVVTALVFVYIGPFLTMLALA